MKRVCFWAKTSKKTKRKRRRSMKRKADAQFQLDRPYNYIDPMEKFSY